MVCGELVEVVDCELVLEQELFFDFLDEFFDSVQSEVALLLLPSALVLHQHCLHDLIQSEAVFGQMLLVSLDLDHQLAQALQVSFLQQLLVFDLLLDHLAGESGVLMEEGEQ